MKKTKTSSRKPPATQPSFPGWVTKRLKQCKIPPATARKLGLSLVTAKQINRMLDFKIDGIQDGLAIPYLDPSSGKPIKTQDGKACMSVLLPKPILLNGVQVEYIHSSKFTHPYIMPETHKALLNGAQVVLTMGELGAIAATCAGIPVIGMAHGWGWMGPDKQLLPELQAYAKKGTEWILILGPDAVDNSGLTESIPMLAGELGTKKIRLKTCFLPHLPGTTTKITLGTYIGHPEGGVDNLPILMNAAQCVFHPNNPPTEDELLNAVKFQAAQSDHDALTNLLRLCSGVTDGMDRLAAASFQAKLRTITKEAGVKNFDPVIEEALNLPKQSVRAEEIVEPEPWPEAVNGLDLANEVRKVLLKYLVSPPYAAEVITLWTFHAHAHDASDVSPILALISPQKRCGKTVMLSVLESLVPRPEMTSNITPASLYRMIHESYPTVLIDEADSFMKSRDMIGIINGGHRKRGGFVKRTVNGKPTDFSVWAPKVIARIDPLFDTNQDRAIVVNMRRKAGHENVSRWREKDIALYEPVKRKLIRWASDNMRVLKAADPEIPSGLDDRAADNWCPLIAIADLLGGDWPKLANKAACHFAAQRDEDEQNSRINLLEDIRDILDDVIKDQRFTTESVLRELIKQPESPWPSYKQGRPLSALDMAALLKPFGIKSKNIRMGKAVKKAYDRADFADAFNRYLPPKAATPATPATSDKSLIMIDPQQSGDLYYRLSADEYSSMLGLRSLGFTPDFDMLGDSVVFCSGLDR